MFKTLKNDAAGIAILREWLGDDGVPVPVAAATRRAVICETCPENRGGAWWDRFKNEIALAIRAHLEVKHKVGISVPNEASLFMCRKCGCALRLKVHTPIAHIRHHTPQEVINALPNWCWMKTELETP